MLRLSFIVAFAVAYLSAMLSAACIRSSNVCENVPNAFVANVSSFFSQSRNFVNCSLHDAGGKTENIATLFNLRNGVVLTRLGLDYEASSSIDVVIRCMRMPQGIIQSVCLVRVSIMDENDNSPVFAVSDPVNAFLDENSPLGTHVASVVAFDEDTKGNVDFRLMTSPEVFAIRSSMIGRFALGDVYLVGSLDRETRSEYRLPVEAYDGVFSTRVQVIVGVDDVNDNAPRFDQDNYTFSISEAAELRAFVGQVFAHDTDIGPNGEVHYSLNGSSFFSVDFSTGVLLVRESIRKRGSQTHRFQVKASDRGLVRRSVLVNVTVHISESNWHSPLLSVRFKRTAGTKKEGLVPEDAYLGFVVAYLTVTDDQDVDVRIEQGNDQGTFYIRRKSASKAAQWLSSFYDVETATMLDRESVPQYRLLIRVTDRGNPPLETTETVVFTVSDVNDHRPHFSNLSYHASVSETVLIGTTVLRVCAADGDTGLNAMLNYSITDGNSQKTFEIYHDTGVLVVARSLDARVRQRYNLTVTVSDGQFEISTSVLIDVKDENNKPPVFSQSVYKMVIGENEPAGSHVGNVLAYDDDVGVNSLISYRLFFNRPNATDPFRIDSATGQIFTTSVLDYEKTRVFSFGVFATNVRSSCHFLSSARIWVNVSNENDNVPFFTRHFTPSVSSVSALGSIVTRLKADDADGDYLSYSLVRNDGDGVLPFVVSSDGDVSVSALLQAKVYRISVNVTDGRHSASSDVVITVYDASMLVPTFKNASYAFSVNEAAPSGSEVGRLSASSHDSLQLSYEIVDGNVNSAFSVDQAGIITLNDVVDYELIQIYHLIVTASDTFGAVQRTRHVHVTVSILNANDHSPLISRLTPSRVFLSQLASVGSAVITVIATDEDADLLTYSLVTTRPVPFCICNRRSGLVSLTQSLLTANFPSYDIQVNVSDGLHSTVFLFSVQVNDVNQNAPFFRRLFPTTVAEDTVVGLSLTTITAIDRDFGCTASVRYAFLEASTDLLPFQIDAVTGTVTLVAPLDYEEQSDYNVTVIAKDSGFPQKTTTAVWFVSVGNVNELAPVFSSSLYDLNVLESAHVGTVIGTVSAVDPDGCSALTYALASDVRGVVAIGESSGVVRLNATVDRERISEIRFNVQAWDCGSPRRTSTAIVCLTVLDVNDEAPTFATSRYYVNVRKDFPVGGRLMTLRPEDLDEGTEFRFYRLQGDGSTWKVGLETGDLTSIRPLESSSYVLRIATTDDAPPYHSATVTIVVNVTQYNHHRPRFRQSLAVLNVTESVCCGTFMSSLPAVDNDAESVLNYYLSRGSGMGLFSVSSTTGDLQVFAKLDRELKMWYNLTLTVQDNSIDSLVSEMNIIVVVLDENDNPPAARSDYVSGIVLRCTEGDEIVAVVSASDVDEGGAGQVAYELNDSYFDIDSIHGIVTSKRDTFYGASFYNLLVSVKDRGEPSLSSSVLVRVQTVDCLVAHPDFRPQFLGLPYVTKVVENRPYKHLFQPLVASTGGKGGFHFQLTSDTDSIRFAINCTTGVLSCKTLDYEKQQNHTVGFVASIGNAASTAYLEIQVIDIYEERPQFSQSSYAVTIREDLNDHEAFVQIRARGYMPVIYNLVWIDPKARAFYIDSLTGNVSKCGQLDYEANRQYVLYVQAEYRGAQRRYLFSVTTLTVTLVDVDDNLPMFDESPYYVTLRSRSVMLVNNTIATVYAVDADSGTNAAVEYRMLPYFHSWWLHGPINDQSLQSSLYFSINSITGELSLARAFPASFAVLDVVAENPFNRSRKVVGCLHLSVATNGTKIPSFGPLKVISIDVAEDKLLPFVIQPWRQARSVIPTPLRYFIHGRDFNRSFVVNRTTGHVTLVKSVSVGRYLLLVRVLTDVFPSLSDEITYSINIFSVNRHSPAFSQSLPLRVSMDENSPMGSFVAWVKAYDPDVGRDGKVFYSIRDNDKGIFAIDSMSGRITIEKPINYELSDVHLFTVVATDRGSHPRRSLLPVQVRVVNRYDPPPLFLSSRYHATLREDVDIGTFVVNVTAISQLSSPSDVVYSTSSHLFRVDPLTGFVSVSSQLDRESLVGNGTLLIDLFASSSGSWSMATTSVCVTLIDVNDNFPVFEQSLYLVDVIESASPGSIVVSVHANDPDEKLNGAVKYSLKLENYPRPSFFGVLSNGSVVLLSRLDREMRSHYSIVIKAEDGGSPSKANYVQVHIRVTDANDHPPVFASSFYKVNIRESVAVGTPIFAVQASDENEPGSNSNITYAISNFDQVGRVFSIGQSSGVIRLISPLRFENVTFYSLVIKASDNGSTVMTGSSTLHVRVMDDAIDGHPPRFTQDVYRVTMVETNVVGRTVVAPRVVSPYRITFHGHSMNFSINSATGLVATTTTLDYEQEKNLVFRFYAVDAFHRRTTARLIVSLLDVNDNAPEFRDEVTAWRVPSEASIGVKLWSVVARDRDSGLNGEVRYFITDDYDASMFSIDSITGQLTLQASVLNFRDARVLEIAVQARDLGSPSFTALYPAVVYIRVIRSVRPRFLRSVYRASIVAPGDVEVVRVTAWGVYPLSYSIHSGDDGRHFRINSTSGHVVVARSSGLGDSVYRLRVQVNDGFHVEYTLVFVRVSSLFRFVRSLESGIAIREDTPIGSSPVGTIFESAFVNVLFQVKPRFTDFNVTDEGNLVLAAPLDREFQDSYILTVEAAYPNFTHPIRRATTTFQVNVTDVNDNYPQFLERLPMTGYLRKNLRQGSIVYTVLAIDAEDGESWNVIPDGKDILQVGGGSYSYLPLSYPFLIENSGNIVLTRASNSNMLDAYNLTIQVSDSGGLKTTAFLTLFIVDDVVKKPFFEHSNYKFAVSESSPVGTPVGRVRGFAFNGDPVSDLDYFFVDGNLGGAFHVDSFFGLITVDAPLDYERLREYVLVVRLHDNACFSCDADFVEVDVTIVVQDANDNAPTLTSSATANSLRVTVDERTKPGRLTSIAAYDADKGTNGQLVFMKVTEMYDDKFSLHPTKGFLFLKKRLDYEETSMYAFDVVIRDLGRPTQYIDVKVYVDVANANDVVPRFVDDRYRFLVSDSAPKGTLVGQVLASDKDHLSPLVYSIDHGNDQNVFALDRLTGALTLNRASQSGRYLLDVQVFDGDFHDDAIVDVYVGNVNAHNPSFVPPCPCRGSVPEGSPLGTFVARVTAVDPDYFHHGVVNYVMEREGGKFAVDNQTGDVYTNVSGSDLLIPPNRLPHEVIRAYDGGGRSAFCSLEVTLTDINNHAPRFSLPSYQVTVKDSIDLNDVVLRVSAVDEDEGSNAEIRYDVLPKNSAFFVYPDSGRVQLSFYILDAKVKNRYFFQVRATDHGQPSLSSTVDVTVNVVDALSTVAEFDRFYYDISVREDVPVGTVVIRMNTTLHETAPVVYRAIEGGLASWNGPRRFDIGNVSGVVRTTSLLDRETVPEINVIIEASNPFAPTYAVLRVTVIDVNDCSPRFQEPRYSFRIPENSAVGTIVGQVLATDKDVDSNARISYAIDDSQLFSIDNVTGSISAMLEFDREFFSLPPPQISFYVIASDHGSPSRNSSILVFINVTDVNDNVPRLNPSEYAVVLKENVIPPYTLPVKLLVEDSDEFSDFRYILTKGNTGYAFTLSSERGKLLLQTKLDYESIPFYRLQINVSDGLFQSTAFINVTILDVNDEAPAFSNASYKIRVKEDASLGTSFYRLSAFDPDLLGDSISYSIVDDSLSSSYFMINSTLGFLMTQQTLDRETRERFVFTAAARDSAGHEGYATVIVEVLDVNDNAPTFDNTHSFAHIMENARIGTRVGRYTANDVDVGLNSKLTYSLYVVEGNDFDGFLVESRKFYVNETSGWIFVSGSLDRESVSRYNAIIRANDGGTPSYFSETMVTIVVHDVNDNAPHFDSYYMQRSIYDDAPIGSTVLALSASDDDEGANGRIRYWLDFGNDDQVFSMDNGVITVAKRIPPFPFRYRLEIGLVDGGDPALVGDGVLIVDILDVNDHPPVFSMSTYRIALPENALLFTSFLTVNATDNDRGRNAEFQFRLIDSYGRFSIGPQDGRLYLTAFLDYEEERFINLTVEAIDDGLHNQLTGFAQVLIEVTDVNDNEPVFESQSYQVSVKENILYTTESQPLVTVSAVDYDSGNGGIVHYVMLSKTSLFRLDSVTGGFFADSVFDREVIPFYEVTVLAVDGGSPSLSKEATIFVTVLDENDNPSQGGRKDVDIVSTYNRSGLEKGMLISNINAGDPDVGDSFRCKDVLSTNFSRVSVDLNCSVLLLSSKLEEGFSAELQVSATDGIHPYVACAVSVRTHFIRENDLDNVVVIELNDTVDNLVDAGYSNIIDSFARGLEISRKSLRLVSVQESNRGDSSYVSMAVDNWSKDMLLARLSLSLERFLPLALTSLPVDLCAEEPCKNLAECISIASIDVNQLSVVETSSSSFLQPVVSLSFTCLCKPGSTGSLCETDIDDCFSSPCQNGGTCIDKLQNFVCQCPHRASGRLCENIGDICELSMPCENGGTCRNDITTSRGYTCLCPNSYVGDRCEISVFHPVDNCAGRFCLNGGVCTAGRFNFTCTCLLGFTGKRCGKTTADIRPCTSNPCRRGGSCRNLPTGNFGCKCESGFFGSPDFENSDCMWEKDPCDILPCLNGGTCLRGRLGLYACECESGVHCEIAPPLCQSNPCHNDGVCRETDGSGRAQRVYNCTCSPLYYGEQCEYPVRSPDHCASMPCRPGSSCTSGRDGYTCTCRSGFQGKLCERIGSGDSACSSNPCLHGGFCVSIANESFSCECSPGFYGETCDLAFNYCQSTPCKNGGTCHSYINSFTCSCPTSVGGRFCEIFCPTGLTGFNCDVHVDASNDSCADNMLTTCKSRQPPCHCYYGGICDSNGRCSCPYGFEGPKCELLGINIKRGSYRAFSSLRVSSSWSVSLQVSTVVSGGLVFYNAQLNRGRSEDVISLELVHGQVTVLLNFGDGSKRFVVGSPRVDDGKWHTVLVKLAGDNVLVAVDHCAVTESGTYEMCQASGGLSQGNQRYLNLGLPFYFGSAPGRPEESFEGCIRDVQINGHLFDLANYVLNNGTANNCAEMTSCQNDSCINPSLCVENYSGYKCTCPLGSAGYRCEKGNS